jgi:hypothetical protein
MMDDILQLARRESEGRMVWPTRWPPGFRPVGFFTTGFFEPGGFAEGGMKELLEFLPSFSSRSLIRFSVRST